MTDPYEDYEAPCQCGCGGGCACGCDCPGDGWQPGECDHCHGGEPTPGPLGPIYCACAVGQGADPEDCRCGPPAGEDD